jgi:ubiquinone/menaquinone biosynthesis C-methylase UbiE
MSNTAKITEWYNNNVLTEHGRLVNGKLEFTITLRTILNSLSKDKPLRIADIGGGTGRYGMYITISRRWGDIF